MKLSERWTKELTAQPETGMGYQVVSITLKDGRILDDIVITNSERLEPEEWFLEEDIINIKLKV
jgi:hypothetical protein